MAEFFNIDVGEVKRFYFKRVDPDGDDLNLTDYTITPYLYFIDDRTVYLSGSAAGSVEKSSTATEQFYWETLSTTFPSGSQEYLLRFQFASGSINPKLPVKGDDFVVRAA